MQTPLHYTAKQGKKDAVKPLINNNIHFNAFDLEFQTALHLAASEGMEDMVVGSTY